jgi:LemA protein
MDTGYIVLIVIALIIFYIMGVYNKAIRLIEAMNNSEAQISVQLDARGKKFDSLINAVKQAQKYENETLTKVTELRSQAVKIDGDALHNMDMRAIEDQLSQIIGSGKLTSAINMTMEAYPDLKANTNMLQLQEEIVNIENKLSYAKQAYNDSIEAYESYAKSVPPALIVGLFKQLQSDHEYWDLSEEKIEAEESKRVSFE